MKTKIVAVGSKVGSGSGKFWLDLTMSDEHGTRDCELSTEYEEDMEAVRVALKGKMLPPIEVQPRCHSCDVPLDSKGYCCNGACSSKA